MERIAEAGGFGDGENMKRAFIKIYDRPQNQLGGTLAPNPTEIGLVIVGSRKLWVENSAFLPDAEAYRVE
ncbi:hypothetical protein ACUS6C_04140 [Pseudomonas aeruginosa]